MENNKKQYDIFSFLCIALFIISVVYSFGLLLKYVSYPILESFAFRQTQTAISTLYLMDSLSINGILNYETPVLGYPWSIPFEFPIYQVLCALLSKYLHIPLDMTGRIVSWIFMILCLYPIYFLAKKIDSSKNLFYIIGALFMFSPQYILWGKSFMIETCALFFGFMFLMTFILYLDKNKFIYLIELTLFATLCGLTKITTLPGFLFLAFIYFIYKLHKKRISMENVVSLLIYGIISFSVCLLWVKYADSVKTLNAFATNLTSENLRVWNFGALNLRLSPDFYKVLFFRINTDIFGNFIIFLVSLISLFFIDKKYKNLAICFILSFYIPIFVFANLYFVHDYYPTANAIFFLFALGFIFVGLLKKNKLLTFVFFVFTLIAMYIRTTEYNHLYENAKYSESIRVAEFIQKIVPENKSIVSIGINWSSELNYLSKRKGLAIPNFEYDLGEEFLKNSSEIGGLPIGAFIWKNPSEAPNAYKIKNIFINKNKPSKRIKTLEYEIYYNFQN